jgi:serine/threonine-protein kinase
MAMEFLDGKDLSAHCNAKKLLPFADVLQIAADVADALAYAHKNDVVHRDIKPSNLMLLKNGSIKVTDFGIARVVNSSQTQTGTILGTPSYMSPEQVSGDRVKGASDLFSLGVVCYELLSGQKPFAGDSLGALMHNIANVKYSPLKKVKPGLPESCYTIVRKLLKKEIRDRYRNATEVADALKKCIAKTG